MPPKHALWEGSKSGTSENVRVDTQQHRVDVVALHYKAKGFEEHMTELYRHRSVRRRSFVSIEQWACTVGYDTDFRAMLRQSLNYSIWLVFMRLSWNGPNS